MAVSPPEGMLPATWDYLLAFTKSHEGPTPFMYNNYPLKTDKQDVTCGIGFSIRTEDEALNFQRLFRVKATGQVPTDTEMRTEFKRVKDIDRTATNLYTDYEAKSPLTMDMDAVWEYMQSLMKGKFDGQRGQPDTGFLSHFKEMPAQAQVALVSYNYGWAIIKSPSLCRILNKNYLDFGAAQDQVVLDKDNPERAAKNLGHQTLMSNASRIVLSKDSPAPLDWNLLPAGYHPPSRL
jgi:hypothetical protein